MISVQHNMLAMNADRQLNTSTNKGAKITEKLSSGYRINRAADDAAGLAISEKMRRQIRGLAQASNNILDGISLCQVADGALNETVDILQRMRELAVKSANGTNSKDDRQFIDMEITQLKNEVDRIAKTTNFNDAIYPLNASATESTAPTNPNPNPNPNPSGIKLYEQTVTFETNVAITYNDVFYNVGDTITVTGMTTNGREIRFDDGCAWIAHGQSGYSIYWSFDVTPGKGYDVKESDLKVDTNGHIYFDSKVTGGKWYYTYRKNNDTTPDPIGHGTEVQMVENVKNGAEYFTVDNLQDNPPPPPSSPATATTNLPIIYIQAGISPSQADKIPVYLVDATCKGLGITDLTAATTDSSGEALDLLSDAISKASTYRSTFGTTQNRLEHAYNINKNVEENTQAAESLIRDADIADLMMEYSINNILMQAGTSMLTQANQSSQLIIELLQQ